MLVIDTVLKHENTDNTIIKYETQFIIKKINGNNHYSVL